MPFPRPKLLAVLAFLALTGAAGVLYVIHARAVHAGPPASLARLVLVELPAPDIGFVDANGRRVRLNSFRGHFVLINLWATWCAPCVRELPQLAQLKAALPALTIVAVNVGREDAKETATFLRQHNAGALPVYIDKDQTLIGAFGTQGLPYTAILNPMGQEIAHALGPGEWAAPDAATYLRELTAGPARTPPPG